MKDEDIQNLLGGFATDTLTAQERELLFTAALKDQELFNAMADEQALRDFLSDPANRRRLLQSLGAVKPGMFEQMAAWMRRPASWAVAGAVVAALIVAVAVRQTPRRDIAAVRPAAEMPREEDKLAGTENRPAAAAPMADVRREKAATAPKMKVAVLDFDSGPAQAKDAQVASDLLGKKLDSEGYAVVDRKRVDEAMKTQNLNNRSLDASAAASLGRQVGADAVIVGSVKPAAPQAVGGFRDQERAKEANEQVAVTATAINTQTAANVAYAQSGQAQAGGVSAAVDQVAVSLTEQFQQKARAAAEGLVTEVNAKTLTLNIGARAGVKVGDRLTVIRDRKLVGQVVIVSVQDTTATGSYQGLGDVNVGDTVSTAPGLPLR